MQIDYVYNNFNIMLSNNEFPNIVSQRKQWKEKSE